MWKTGNVAGFSKNSVMKGKNIETPDEKLVLAAQKGDRERFNELVARYSPRISNYVKKRISDWHTAEDVTQETFTRAFASIGKCTKPEGFLAWLYEIARNCINKSFEKNRTAQDISTIEISDRSIEKDEFKSDRVASLSRALTTLPEETRKILVLKFNDGLKCREIAEKLGKPVSSITRILSETYSKLDKILSPFIREE